MSENPNKERPKRTTVSFTTPPGQPNRRRSLRSVMLDRSTQLRLAITMTAVSALIMAGLGYWVAWAAQAVVTIGENQLRVAAQEMCGSKEVDPPPFSEPASSAGNVAPVDGEARPGVAVKIDDSQWPTSATPGASNSAGPATGAEAITPGNQAESASPSAPGTAVKLGTPTAADAAAEKSACEAPFWAKISDLRQRQTHLLIALFTVGLAVTFGLFWFGVRLTHRVAGPLMRMQGYLSRLRRTGFEVVTAVRRNDYVRDFYEHFAIAYESLRTQENEDIEAMKRWVAELEKQPNLGADGLQLCLDLKARIAHKTTRLGQPQETK